MRNRLEFAVAIQLLRTCRTVGKHSSEQKNHTWIIYNWAILYSSTLIGRGILYSLINIIIRTRATKIRSDVDRREKFSMACFNRRPETLVSHKSEMSKSRTACKLSAENKHNSYSAGRKPSWMTSRSIGTDGEPHFQIIENLWNRSQTGCPVQYVKNDVETRYDQKCGWKSTSDCVRVGLTYYTIQELTNYAVLFDWWLSLQSKEIRMSHDFFFP